MFGRLHYTPAEYYRMGWVDLMAAVDGFNDAETAEMNRFRHMILAPSWAMGSKQTVRQVMPIPSIDGVQEKADFMSKQQFLMLAKTYKDKHKPEA